MGEKTNISWTDSTFNPWICTKVSPGCANCYAETLMDKRYGKVKWGKGQPRNRTSEAYWKQPLKWDAVAYWGRFRQCPECGWRGEVTSEEMDCPTKDCQCAGLDMFTCRPRVFCGSLCDWLDDEVPIEWLADLLALIHATPNLDWLLLTKRPHLFLSRTRQAAEWVRNHGNHGDLQWWILAWNRDHEGSPPPSNVWIGTSVEDQTRADERIPALLRVPARVRFLSCEPTQAGESPITSHLTEEQP